MHRYVVVLCTLVLTSAIGYDVVFCTMRVRLKPLTPTPSPPPSNGVPYMQLGEDSGVSSHVRWCLKDIGESVGGGC